MNKVVGLSVAGALAVVALVLGMSYVSAYNAGNKAEKQIFATYTDNQNVLAQYGQKVQEAAQIPAMQRDDVTKVVTAALTSRYGKDGSQAMMQWIKEQNPTLDSKVYVQLQRIIEAGRNDFQVAQTKLIDQKRGYETQLGSFWRGTWLEVAGYPKVNLDLFKVVTTTRAKETFEKGVEDAPINLRTAP